MTASSSSTPAVRQALVWLAIFTLPFGLPLVGALAILGISGELSSLDSVVRRQVHETRTVLFGEAYEDRKAALKYAHRLAGTPPVVALGNSRVMQFRSGFFVRPSYFYNAGGLAGHIPDFRAWFAKIPADHQPAILLIGLEHSYFNANWHAYDGDNRAAEAEIAELLAPVSPFDRFEQHWRNALLDVRNGKVSLPRLADRSQRENRIGLNAIMNGNGFRNDGSYRYGQILANPANSNLADFQFRESLQRIEKGSGRFAHGQKANEPAVAELAKFLALCQQRGIHVIGFLPPYAPTIYDALKRPQTSYLFTLESILRPLFDRHGFSFADFSDPRVVGSSDQEMLDGNHGSEKTYLRLLLEMGARDAQLLRYLDLDQMRRQLAAAPNRLEVFASDL